MLTVMKEKKIGRKAAQRCPHSDLGGKLKMTDISTTMCAVLYIELVKWKNLCGCWIGHGGL